LVLVTIANALFLLIGHTFGLGSTDFDKKIGRLAPFGARTKRLEAFSKMPKLLGLKGFDVFKNTF